MLSFIFEVCVWGENFCLRARKTMCWILWERILKGTKSFPVMNLEIPLVCLCPICCAWWNSDIQSPLTVTCAGVSVDIMSGHESDRHLITCLSIVLFFFFIIFFIFSFIFLFIYLFFILFFGGRADGWGGLWRNFFTLRTKIGKKTSC